MFLEWLLNRKSNFPILRIDDRLVHGQVIVGWGEKLKLQRIILASDRVAQDEMLSELYTSLIPPEIEARVLKIGHAAELLELQPLTGKQMVVVENIPDAVNLLESGMKTSKIIIGGLHFIEGSKRVLSYVFLDETRKEQCRSLLDKGVPVVCQDLPANPPYKITAKVLDLYNGE